MAYSTAEEAIANAAQLTRDLSEDIAAITVDIIANRIAEADKYLRACLGRFVAFDKIDDTDPLNVPPWLNVMSQYKSMELILVWQYGAKRLLEEVNDIDYWRNKFEHCYELFLKGIADGSIDLGELDNRKSRPIQINIARGEYGCGTDGMYDCQRDYHEREVH